MEMNRRKFLKLGTAAVAGVGDEGLRSRFLAPQRQESGSRPGSVARRGDRRDRHGAQNVPQRAARPGVGGADHPEHQARLFALEFQNSRFNPDA